MDYLEIARSIRRGFSPQQQQNIPELYPKPHKPQSDDERIASIAWTRMRLIHREQSNGGSLMLFL